MSAEPLAPSDAVGYSTLQHIGQAERFNKWMFDAIEPYITGKTLEIGSGTGNMSTVAVERGLSLVLSDTDPGYCQLLQQKFKNQPLIEDIFPIDLGQQDFEKAYGHLLGTFDTVFGLNVIEHIGDDHLALVNIHRLLRPDGTVILLMPAYSALFNNLDKSLGHHKRYNRSAIKDLLSPRFNVIKIRYFNLAGIGGWFLFGTLLRRKQIAQGQMGVFDRLVPLFRWADQLTGNRIGLSIIGVGKKRT